MELINVTAGLDLILKEKKKNGKCNKKQSALYTDYWKALLKIQGFSESTEKYFYNGFILMGAGPYKEYLDTVENKSKELKKMLNSKGFNSNVDLRFRIATSLLCEFINDSGYESELLQVLLPKYCYFALNKDGHIAESSAVSIYKFLILKINMEKDIRGLETLNANPQLVKKLKNFFENELSKIEKKTSAIDKDRVEKIKQWVGISKESQTKEADVYQKIKDVNKDHEENSKDKKNNELEKINKKIEEENKSLKRDLILKDKEINILKNKNIELKETVNHLNELKKSQSETFENLSREHEVVVEKLNVAEAEIGKTRELLRLAQGMSSEELNKKNAELSAKLKPFFKAYKDIKGKEMDIRLGEMLKFIFDDMLKVLEKYNIKMR